MDLKDDEADGRASKPRARRDCIVIHHPTNGGPFNGWPVITIDGSRISYICYAHEICPSTGSHHVQGYVEWTGTLSSAQKRAALGLPAAGQFVGFRESRGSLIDNQKYCSKEGRGLMQFGIPKEQGKSKAFKELCDVIRDGGNYLQTIRLDEVGQFDSAYCSRHAALGKLATLLHDSSRNRVMPEVIIHIGESGCGKTSLARSICMQNKWRFIYVAGMSANGGAGWFDGYTDQDALIFNNVDRDWKFDYASLMEICDRYDKQVPTKGGYANLKYLKAVFFTSVYDYTEWFLEPDPAQQGARKCRNVREFERRITVIRKHFHDVKPWQVIGFTEYDKNGDATKVVDEFTMIDAE